MKEHRKQQQQRGVLVHALAVTADRTQVGGHVNGCSRQGSRIAAKAATTALVVATRAAIDRFGAGNGVPPLAPEGGHHERRPTTEDWHQHQAMDVEQVLDVPVLHIDCDDHSTMFVEPMTLQEIPEVQVPVECVQQRLVEQIVDLLVSQVLEQVNAQSIPAVQVPVERVQQRHDEHSADLSSCTRSASSWLDAPQEHFDGFSALLPDIDKV